MDFWTRAHEIKDEMVAHRRYFHENAEVGMETVKAADYVMAKLTEMGYEPRRCGGNGVVAVVGKAGGKCLMLRADMDALPMMEESGEPFACKTGAVHACGHDMHAAWLLGAAKLLKENEGELKGCVKLMFQPGEEVFGGCKAMLADGVLENPKPDVAISFHTAPGRIPLGLHMYNDTNTMMYSNDSFRIVCKGVATHGAYPELGVSPINIAAHVYLGMQEIIAREKACTVPAVLTVGKINAGLANNSIPEEAVMEGTLRTTDKELREKLKGRLITMVEKTAEAYGGSAVVEWTAEVPPVICNPDFTKEVLKYMAEVPVPGQYPVPGMQASASEDFACILDLVPGTLMYLSAGFLDRDVAPSHNSKVVFNEDALPTAAAYMAHTATRWLEDHAE